MAIVVFCLKLVPFHISVSDNDDLLVTTMAALFSVKIIDAHLVICG